MGYSQDRDFKMTAKLLFDGEVALTSKKAQKEIHSKFNIVVHAEPFFKRLMAERAIKEIKLRMRILLNLKSNFFLILFIVDRVYTLFLFRRNVKAMETLSRRRGKHDQCLQSAQLQIQTSHAG